MRCADANVSADVIRAISDTKCKLLVFTNFYNNKRGALAGRVVLSLQPLSRRRDGDPPFAEELGRMVIDAAKSAGVEFVVFVSRADLESLEAAKMRAGLLAASQGPTAQRTAEALNETLNEMSFEHGNDLSMTRKSGAEMAAKLRAAQAAQGAAPTETPAAEALQASLNELSFEHGNDLSMTRKSGADMGAKLRAANVASRKAELAAQHDLPLEAYFKASGLKGTILRPTSLFGARPASSSCP